MLNTYERQVAQGSTLLRSLPLSEVEALLAAGHIQDCSSGETVFIQGDQAKHVFVILYGWVKLYRGDENGQEAVVTVLTKGHSFGEAVALEEENFPVSAECATACRLLKIPAKNIIDRIEQNPNLARSLLASTFKHLHELVVQIESLKARTGAQRVATFLLELSPSQTGSCIIKLPYEKHLIAGRLGLKPESLSRVFSRLGEHGVSNRKRLSTGRRHCRVKEANQTR